MCCLKKRNFKNITWLGIFCRVNIVPADALAVNTDRASAGMILTGHHQA